ncbi:UDP-glucuronosyltransferase 2B15 [Lucilia cuprina]|nr:UDP-glucuronosyltransferase 2B15 [Lucilia cuprina]
MGPKKVTFLSILLTVCVTWQIGQVDSANILGLFTSHSPSHLIVHMSVVKALAERGHNITVVASQVPKVKHDKIHFIIIPPTEEQEQILNKEVSGMALKKNNIFTTVSNFFGSLKLLIDMQADVLKHPRFTALYENPDTKFDLVIVGYFMNSFEYGVAAKFKVPLVISWSASSMLLSDIMVVKTQVSYVPGMNMAVKLGEKMTFLERIQNFFSNLFFHLVKELLDIRMRSFYHDLFPTDGSFPSLSEMEKNISLVFCNGHFSEGPIRPNVPAVVEIGGIQVKDTPDPLPEDIAKFLDSANETGAILFSLGSNLQGSSIKPETATYIFNVLSNLKQKVIWKWEDLKNTPGKSNNILYKKWMPQDDILAHPNIKLFITHAGKGGVAEAQYHGVPMVALPVFADQHGNAMKMVANGYGKYLELLTLTEDPFREAILDVLNNPQYRENVQRFSQLYRDRPLTARETVVFWTEYVLRHYGAAHMQSPLVHMNFIESHNLDVYLFIMIILYVIYRIFKFIVLLIFAKVCKKAGTNFSSFSKIVRTSTRAMTRKSLAAAFGILLTICFLTWQVPQVNGANILGIFTSHSTSHLIIHMSVAKVLAERGHNVTIVASQEPKVKHDKINMIIIPPSSEVEELIGKAMKGMATQKTTFFTTVGNFFGSLKPMIDMQADMLKDPRFTALYENPDTKFDLIIMGYFMNSFVLGMGARFKAPLVISWMGPPMILSDIFVGNPSEVSYVPDMNMSVKVGEKMTFLQRLQNLFMNMFFRLFKQILDIRMRHFYSELYPTDGSFPSLSDMEKNVSLIFCNSHFTEGPIRPNVPAVVEIGGIQVKDKPEPLPEDIAKFLDSANKTGAILFSLGSNLRGSSIKPETTTHIFNVLSKLKQKVIWKWEDLNKTPGKSPNILYKKWMPQDDILAHPNVKLFITHAGKGGVAEAQYHGVPMVALPVFADQHGNAKKLVDAGYGKDLELLKLTEESLYAAIVEVLNNPEYTKNVQTFSKLYRDRPLTARENVAFWAEYVIRHHGAAHMQSPLVHMTTIESLNLDIYLLLSMIIYIIYRLLKLLVLCVVCKLCRNSSKTITKKAKKSKKVKAQ